MTTNNSFVVCIPTYKRSHLLQLLIQDILKQALRPNHLIIVDGDPYSGSVLDILSEITVNIPIIYIPSNHGNLAYQRYLGWRAASNTDANVLIYFDDDERLLLDTVFNWLVTPFDESDVVGVGCKIRFGNSSDGSDASLARRFAKSSKLSRLLGSGRNIAPGELTPTGHRKALHDGGELYAQVQWLRGGVMAYRLTAMSEATFCEDLFATYECKIGRAEDTFLSRRVGAYGRMLFTFRTVVDHPNADTPKAYYTDAMKFAYAAIYSRRLLNDHYRVYEPPTLSDRLALIKSYAGNVLLAWMKAAKNPSRLNVELGCGTTLGALHGLTRPPTAKRLTPHINWRADAEAALAETRVISPAIQGSL